MAKCKDCGVKVGTFSHYQGRCEKCAVKIRNEIEAARLEAAVATPKAKSYEEVVVEKYGGILLTTETQATDLKIMKRIDIITAECVYGMHFFKDIAAGARDIFGGRSKVTQNTLRDLRKTVLAELRKEAHEVGANAVVGVDLDYSEFTGGNAMLFVVASGTAVVIETNEAKEEEVAAHG